MQDIQFHFSGRNYVVVGASSGLGRQMAQDLAAAEAHVLAIARNTERLLSLQQQFPDKISTVTLDVLTATVEDWESTITSYVQEFGKVHGGIYTAGITGISTLKAFDPQTAHAIMDTSFWCMVQFIQCITQKRYAMEGASYVVLSSSAAYHAPEGLFAYSAGKAAVKTAVQSLAKELSRKKQRINSISPAWIETPMTVNHIQYEHTQSPQNHYRLGPGHPGDVSNLALFLLSDAARWMTGTDIIVDGGGKSQAD